jgi:fluoride exporter
MSLFWVMLGGAMGAVLRYLTNLGMARVVGSSVLTGTVAANLTGCLLAGIFMGWMTTSTGDHSTLFLFISVGLLGSYTTFSTFSLELAGLLKESFSELITYLVFQLLIAFGLAAAGFWIGRQLTGGGYG